MSTPNPVHSSTNLFRRLSWQTSISISIRIADGEPGAGIGADRYFIQTPRYTYLPLLIPEIRESLVELALDDKQIEETDEKDWWFEEEEDEDEAPGGFARQGACRWHWPIDLISIHSYISRPRPLPLPSSSSSTEPKQLKLLLHLSKPPIDRLLMPNNIETCKTQWLNQIKEADFVRWRNTNKVTGLRKTELDNGWDGIVQDDYDAYLRMASRVLPLPIAPAVGSNMTSPNPSRPPSTDPSGSTAKAESAYSTRAIPIKIYLPDNAPVIQEVIPPIGTDGKPTTLLSILRQHLHLLFPSRSPDPYSLAFPVAQGILIPEQSEVAWLAACMCGADGWLRIGICLRAQ
ncbi:autophagy protein 5 [Kwoniella mangroviensis CBS 10435]|uniref:Autophagy protein 5 n=1 Tax=Kwoniella mangroviensis CBS 10435 TaxID=1331196 RepID=A0A1B9ITL6_9TREE|nr:autophagy protein 5 [Kwoniella mangroviensis CBS 8507]OCF58881.1 autophagy protein 5 [Kwoniella mangroviensis CBS 10435]OCF68673.1 autophagy protein 5 [Kwoniella mangroviensis CBS 8507]OCF76864.1 autophagy protein 5 [Kwoniella mangroviensis CBS 8886]